MFTGLCPNSSQKKPILHNSCLSRFQPSSLIPASSLLSLFFQFNYFILEIICSLIPSLLFLFPFFFTHFLSLSFFLPYFLCSFFFFQPCHRRPEPKHGTAASISIIHPHLLHTMKLFPTPLFFGTLCAVSILWWTQSSCEYFCSFLKLHNMILMAAT